MFLMYFVPFYDNIALPINKTMKLQLRVWTPFWGKCLSSDLISDDKFSKKCQSFLTAISIEITGIDLNNRGNRQFIYDSCVIDKWNELIRLKAWLTAKIIYIVKRSEVVFPETVKKYMINILFYLEAFCPTKRSAIRKSNNFDIWERHLSESDNMWEKST